MGRTKLPNSPIYVPEDSQETMPAPEWGSFLSIVDVQELQQVLLAKAEGIERRTRLDVLKGT